MATGITFPDPLVAWWAGTCGAGAIGEQQVEGLDPGGSVWSVVMAGASDAFSLETSRRAEQDSGEEGPGACDAPVPLVRIQREWPKQDHGGCGEPHPLRPELCCCSFASDQPGVVKRTQT